MPVILTEFGSDAFNTIANKEDQEYQAKVLLSNWKEIYENTNGMGKNDNSLGGFTFQFSDGWWKTGQTINLMNMMQPHPGPMEVTPTIL